MASVQERSGGKVLDFWTQLERRVKSQGLMASAELFVDSGSDGGGVDKVKVDEKYAARYNERKRKESLKQLAETLKSNGDETDESVSSTEEDSDAELLTREVQKNILNTLSKIKQKDASIYDPNTCFFDEAAFEPPKAKRVAKPLTFSRFMVDTLKKEGAEAFSNDFEKAPNRLAQPPEGCFEAEQRKLKQEFLQAAALDNDEELFETTQKTAEEKEQEEMSFREFLKRRVQNHTDESVLLSRYLNDDEALDEKEKFLRDYIIFEGWKEGNQMPQGKFQESNVEPFQDNEEETFTQEANQLEALYNFRYEEQPSSTIQGHARQVFDSLRQKEEKRRRERRERQERKAREKEEKKQQLERLKKLKKEELLKRLMAIQTVVGRSTHLSLEDVDLDGDFNPGDHEKQMNIILGENYDEHPEYSRRDIEKSKAVFESLIEPEVLCQKLSRKQIRKMKKKKKLKDQEELDDEAPYAPLAEQEGLLPEEHHQLCGDPLGSEGGQLSQAPEQEALEDHEWYLCDGCRLGIPSGAKRYECEKCEDFMLCQRCFKQSGHPHKMKSRRVEAHCQPPDEFLLNPVNQKRDALTSQAMHSEEIQKALDEYYALNYEDIVGGIPVRFKYTTTPKMDFGLSTQDILTQPDAQLNQHVSLKKLAPYRPTLQTKRREKGFMKPHKKATRLCGEHTKKGLLPTDRLAAYG